MQNASDSCITCRLDSGQAEKKAVRFFYDMNTAGMKKSLTSQNDRIDRQACALVKQLTFQQKIRTFAAFN